MKRLLSLVLCVLTVCSSFAVVSIAEELLVDSGIQYVDSTVTFDKAPGRGIGRYYWISANKNGSTASYTEHPSGLSTPMYDLSAFSAGNEYTNENYPSVKENPVRVGGVDEELNEQTLEAIRETFETARKLGVQCIPRFAYAWDDHVGAEPAELEMIITHIEQISEILNDYTDIVIAIEGGMIGPWGEMHSSKYAEKNYANAIIGAWVENLDESICVLLRNPTMVVNFAGRLGPALIKDLPLDKDHKAYRIGMYNDGYLGTDNDYGTWGDGFTRKQGVQFLNSQAHIPYGGEMAHTTVEFLAQHNSPIYTDGFVKELYDSHLSYLRNLTTNTTGLQTELERLEFGDEYYFEGMPDVSEYYGMSLQKFMLDHMGYRFVLRDAQLSKEVKRGDVLRLKGSVENTGFGNLLGSIKSEVVLVDAAGKKTYIPVDIDPLKWYSMGTYDYNVTVTVPKDAPAGTYTAYLRFSAVAGEDSTSQSRAVPFANPDVYESKINANNIGNFTVSEEVGGVAEGFAQVNIDFTDINKHWAKDDIYRACIGGLMNGMGAGKFNPDGVATRAQFVTVLYNMEGKPEVADPTTPLTDINGWYKDAITWAYSEGIVNGVTTTTFAPNKQLDRETFATMLYRYAKYKGEDVESVKGDLSKYADAAKVSGWAKEALTWANAKGYINGMSATTIVPKGKATRAQMATILARYVFD